jgi:nitroreductase
MTNPDDFLAFLRQRHSVRAFLPEPVPHAVLARVVEAAITAPSSTNRQPWRFAVVTAPHLRKNLAAAVRARADEMKTIVGRSHHAQEFAGYADFFHEPLESAAAIIVPQYREYPDLIAQLIASGGGDPGAFSTAASMQAELCSTSAATMTLLLQAHAEGLGACWMAGPMVAKREVQALLDIALPWRMLGAVALGYPAGPVPPRPRKPALQVTTWFEDDETSGRTP